MSALDCFGDASTKAEWSPLHMVTRKLTTKRLDFNIPHSPFHYSAVAITPLGLSLVQRFHQHRSNGPVKWPWTLHAELHWLDTRDRVLYMQTRRYHVRLYFRCKAPQNLTELWQAAHFNQLLQTSLEDPCLSSTEVTKKLFLLNSALVLEAYLLQRSLFYRLFRM